MVKRTDNLVVQPVIGKRKQPSSASATPVSKKTKTTDTRRIKQFVETKSVLTKRKALGDITNIPKKRKTKK